MTARSRTSPRLPVGLSPAEDARWWDDHRDYWDATEPREERVSPAPIRRTKPVNLRLPIEMTERLKRAAARRAIPYQTLIRMWLKDDSTLREASWSSSRGAMLRPPFDYA